MYGLVLENFLSYLRATFHDRLVDKIIENTKLPFKRAQVDENYPEGMICKIKPEGHVLQRLKFVWNCSEIEQKGITSPANPRAGNIWGSWCSLHQYCRKVWLQNHSLPYRVRICWPLTNWIIYYIITSKNQYEKQNVQSVGQLVGLWTRTIVIKWADRWHNL